MYHDATSISDPTRASQKYDFSRKDGDMGCMIGDKLFGWDKYQLSREDQRRIRAKNIISQQCTQLSLRKNFKQEVENLFNKTQKKVKNFKGRKLEYVMATLIYLTSKLFSFELTLQQISVRNGLTLKTLQSCYNKFKYIVPGSYKARLQAKTANTNVLKSFNLIDRYFKALGLTISQKKQCKTIVKSVMKSGILEGKTRNATVAACIHGLNVCAKLSLPVKKIQGVTGCTKGTILRNYYQIE